MMEFDEQKFRATVIKALRISPDRYRPDLKVGEIDEWDSVAHLDLVFSLEQAFDLRLRPEEFAELTSLQALRLRAQK